MGKHFIVRFASSSVFAYVFAGLSCKCISYYRLYETELENTTGF